MRRSAGIAAARPPRGRRAACAKGAAVRLWMPLALLGLAAGGRAVPAVAQEPDSARVVEIPEVVVTVTRAPLELRRTPFSVATVARGSAERALPGVALDQALRLAPGVQVDNRYNHALGERIVVRGIGARAQFGVRGVKVIFDGIPATLADGQTAIGHIDPAFVDRIEVIRGPASGLWGNSAGGVIQMGTALPTEAGRRHQVGLTTGSDGLLRTGAESAGRWSEGAYVFRASHLAYEGYREFNESRSLRAHGRVAGEMGAGDLELVFGAVEYDAQNPGSLAEAALREAPHLAFPNNVRQRTGEVGGQRQAGVSWRGPSPVGSLEWSGYVVGRNIDNPIPPEIIGLDRVAGGTRGTITGDGTVAGETARWAVGVEAETQRDARTNHRNEAGERGELTLDQVERVTNLAAFGQVALNVGQRLTALGAIRHDRFRFSAFDHLVNDADPDDSGTRILSAISPSIGLALALSPRIDVFANVTTSFETPTTSELANRPDGAGGFNPELEPQRAVSYELGGRASPGVGVTFDVAVFDLRLSNALVPYEVETSPGRQFFRNAGSARHRGFEASGSAGLWRNAHLTGVYAFTDARFLEFVVDGADHSGNRVPGVAPHRTELALAHEAPAGWSLILESSHSSATPVDDANEHGTEPYRLLGIRGSLPVRLGQLEARMIGGVTNLLDRRYVTSVVVNAFGDRFYEPGPGRSLYVGVTMALGSGTVRGAAPSDGPVPRRPGP